jgi:hypothetical protein
MGDKTLTQLPSVTDKFDNIPHGEQKSRTNEQSKKMVFLYAWSDDMSYFWTLHISVNTHKSLQEDKNRTIMADVVIIRVGLFIRIGDANRQFHQYCAVAGCEGLRVW